MDKLLAVIFGLIVLAIECYATGYLFINGYFWTSVFVFLLGVQTTMSAVWRYLTGQRPCECQEVEGV